jgi:hypothetical protein
MGRTNELNEVDEASRVSPGEPHQLLPSEHLNRSFYI